MHEFHLNSVDLNLLLVFNRIYIRQSLTLAAEDLGRTQSALSHALDRLRVLFDDPLFVRTSNKMQPTLRAEELAPAIKEAVLSIKNVFIPSNQFVPEKLIRTFSISMSDYCQMVILPELLEILHRKAPGVEIEIATPTNPDFENGLASGVFDLVIGNKDMAAGVMQQVLFEDRFVCLINKELELKAERISIQEYITHPHILFTTRGKSDRLIERALLKHGVQRKVAARVPNIMVIPYILKHSPYIVTIPLKLAESLSFEWLRFVPPPVELPGLPIMQYWHAVSQHDPSHSWLRFNIHDLFKDDRGG